MYLKTLIARGFKSFADRVVLEFEPGISVIVGPNGSGKSNVADAVLWVLGEQSPRNLRGSRMEDVIFAGSATRPPQNMAEVSLAFDNSNGKIPVSFPEVVITRRLYRSGESEYLLNRTPCRLTDIQEILSDLGIGRELTAVVGQNRLEAILHSSAQDRRAFIEEVAGLRKHRRRKEKALRKLEAMEANLVRVKDIVAEVNRQLRPLERQARLAEEYRKLVQEIRDLSLRILVAELEELKESWESRKVREEEARKRLCELEGILAGGRERLHERQEEIRRCRQALDEIHGLEMRALSLGERILAARRLGEERLKLYAALSGDPSLDREEWERKREELRSRIATLSQEIEEAMASREELRAKEEELKASLRELSTEIQRAREKRNELRRDDEQLTRRIEACLSKARGLRDKAEEASQELSRLEQEEREVEETLAQLKRRKEELSRIGEEVRTALVEAEEKIEKLKSEVRRFEEDLDSVARKQKRTYQEEALVVARLRALQELYSSQIDYAAAASRVIQEKERVPGVLGMLLHLLRIPEEWESALESYLGPWLFSVVVRRTEDALKAVSLLKEEEAGMAVFLPLEEVDVSRMREPKDQAKACGGVPAREVVESDPQFGELLDFLLGDVVLCSTLEEAKAKAEIYRKLTFVTRDGDVVAPGKAIKGGELPRSPFHLVAKRREIEQLQEMLELCDEENVSLEVQRKSTLSTLKRLKEELDAGERERDALKKRLSALEREMTEVGIKEENLNREREKIGQRRRSLSHRSSSFLRDAERTEEEAEALRKEVEGARKSLEEAEANLAELRDRHRGLEESLHSARAKRASLEERIYHLRERRREWEREASQPPPPDEEEVRRKAAFQRILLGLLDHLDEVHKRVQDAVRDKKEMYGVTLEDAEREASRLAQEMEEARKEEERLKDEIHGSDVAAAQIKTRVDILAGQILEEYQIPLETALQEFRPQMPMDEMRERLRALQRRRDQMGPVNPMAVEEYQALKERHDFLVRQVEDLKESKADLQKVIRAIDQEIIKVFRQTFEEVNSHFQELFQMLFPEGRAELVLSDPGDLMETGVEIEAQPKGKRLRRLSLLSGGETALISLAFLFALFKVRPSPFYFLDEVEAALDDVNLHRFLNMLIEFRGESQLIVITHQKRTMEIADVIYGVSMQANGVSRVVSQKLDRQGERLVRAGTGPETA